VLSVLRVRDGRALLLRELVDTAALNELFQAGLMAGGVFFWKGVLKFVYTNQGVGRFTKLGMPAPELLANATALLEIGGGLLLMAGLFTRLISVPFIVEILVAMLVTKISLYLGPSPLPLPKVGLWAVLHEIRSDYAQIMTSIFLFAAGPGPWSLDAWLARRKTAGAKTAESAALQPLVVGQ
jgi:putative oxidoreductase